MAVKDRDRVLVLRVVGITSWRSGAGAPGRAKIHDDLAGGNRRDRGAVGLGTEEELPAASVPVMDRGSRSGRGSVVLDGEGLVSSVLTNGPSRKL